MLFKFFEAQYKYPCKDDWTLQVNQDLKDFGIPENFEFMLWCCMPFVSNAINDCRHKSSSRKLTTLHFGCYMIWLIGIATNVYWYFSHPWRVNSIRHRTEYNDTQVLLCAVMWNQLTWMIYPQSQTSVPEHSNGLSNPLEKRGAELELKVDTVRA